MSRKFTIALMYVLSISALIISAVGVIDELFFHRYLGNSLSISLTGAILLLIISLRLVLLETDIHKVTINANTKHASMDSEIEKSEARIDNLDKHFRK